MKTKCTKFFPQKSIEVVNFFPRDLATGHFFGKFFSKIAGSGPDGSNDTILQFVSRPGAEPIECQTHTQTHTHTEYGYYNIDKNFVIKLFFDKLNISRITVSKLSQIVYTIEMEYKTALNLIFHKVFIYSLD